MNINKLVNEIIYYYKYFKILDVDNEVLIAAETAKELESIIFIKIFIKLLNYEIQENEFINFRNRKRLDVLLFELENRKEMLSLDQFLEKKSQPVNQ